MMYPEHNIVIVGGGIAGITCLETLLLDSSSKAFKSITLISDSRLVKKVINYSTKGRCLEDFDVTTVDLANIDMPDAIDFKYIEGFVTSVLSCTKEILIQVQENGNQVELKIPFNKLCLCNGSRPKELILAGELAEKARELIFYVRDTTSVEELRDALKGCDKVVVIGNGGIGLELASKISCCDLVWIVRDEYVGRTFLDSGACNFLLEQSNSNSIDYRASSLEQTVEPCGKHPSQNAKTHELYGPALGPSWLQQYSLKGKQKSGRKLQIIYNAEISDIFYNEGQQHPVSICIRDSSTAIDCDMVIAAIGVRPNIVDFVSEKPKVSSLDGGILIDQQMRTSLENIYAAGDVVSCDNWPKNELWFQMRLWTQARQMGHYCAKCIISHLTNEDPAIYFAFDCFSHCTKFFNRKIILIGRYNGQGLSDEEFKRCEVLVRTNSNRDYIKILLKDSMIIGAVLAGETGLDETIENLIYDRINVDSIKEHLLDETIDIEDYFD